MEYQELGRGGPQVSRYCFGSLTLGPLGADLPSADGAALLQKAFALGVNFVDTAEYYRNYPALRLALDTLDEPDRIIIASKTLNADDLSAAYAVEEARIALRRETLDIFLLHEVRDEADWQARAGAWRVLRNARANGVIRQIGLSTHSARVAALAAEDPEVDVLHCMLNLAGVGILDGGITEMLQAISRAKEQGKGVYTMKALGGGSLMRQAKTALTWAFAQEDPDAIAVGCKDEAELLTNLGWLAGEEPREAAACRLLERRLVFDGCCGCGACVTRCANQALSLKEGEARWERERCLFCGYCAAACPRFCISFA